jgi:nucleotide-binding universal stress UspA family protein
MFERMLMPVDFSERSKAIFPLAELFAKTFASEVELLHVVEEMPYNPPFWVGEVPAIGELRRQALTSSEASIKGLASELNVPASVKVRTVVAVGPVPATIVEQAKSDKSDLIIAATQGRTGFAHLLLGSVCERVLRHAPCPVLVAPSQATKRPVGVQKVLVAVDLSTHSKRALQLAAKVASKFGAEVELLHCWAAPYFAADVQLDAALFTKIRKATEKDVQDFVDSAELDPSVKVKQTVVSGIAPASILERLENDVPSLLVLGTHGRSGFKHVLLGSVAEAVVRRASCPTLVVP